MANPSMIHPDCASTSKQVKLTIRGLLFVSFSFFGILVLSGCSSTQEMHARILEHGYFVNGREPVEGSDFAFITGESGRPGVIVTELDGKPFFVEYKFPVLWEAGKWIKGSSPVRVEYGGGLAIPPGKHTVRLRYEHRTPNLLFPSLESSKETTIEFTADPGHGYVIKPNLATDKNSGKFWNPAITDRDAK